MFGFATRRGSRPAVPIVQPAFDFVGHLAREVGAIRDRQPPRIEWPRSDREPAWRRGGNFDPVEVRERAARGARLFERWIERGRNPEASAGLASNAEAESRSNHRQRQEPVGPAQGLMQWEEPRRREFERVFGIPFERSTEGQQMDFIDLELSHPDYQPGGRLEIPSHGHAASISTAILNNYLRPREREKAAIDRANLAEAIIRQSRLPRLSWPRPDLPTESR